MGTYLKSRNMGSRLFTRFPYPEQNLVQEAAHISERVFTVPLPIRCILAGRETIAKGQRSFFATPGNNGPPPELWRKSGLVRCLSNRRFSRCQCWR
jgi:hypothetical protein